MSHQLLKNFKGIVGKEEIGKKIRKKQLGISPIPSPVIGLKCGTKLVPVLSYSNNTIIIERIIQLEDK